MMTIKQFHKEIEGLEELEKEIIKLKEFIHSIDTEKCTNITIYNRVDKNITFEFCNIFVKKMAEEQLDVLLDAYDNRIDKLKKHGLEVESIF